MSKQKRFTDGRIYHQTFNGWDSNAAGGIHCLATEQTIGDDQEGKTATANLVTLLSNEKEWRLMTAFRQALGQTGNGSIKVAGEERYQHKSSVISPQEKMQ